MRVLAVIPARGGSKSIPRKNIALLGGKPLLQYALDAAKGSKLIERIIVDTEDREIAEVARTGGADVPYVRPQELAEDSTTTMSVLRHGLAWLGSEQAYKPDALLLLEPTRPFIRSEQIDRAIETLAGRPDADSLCTVFPLPNRFHPSRIRYIDEHGWLQFCSPEDRLRLSSRQTLPPRYAIGNLWLFRPEVVETKSLPIGDRCVHLPVDELSCFDIDEPLDLRMAEALLPLARVGVGS